MSNRAVAWAFDVEGLTPTQKFLLVALADFADDENSCYPGQELLARRICASRETVSRNLSRLAKLGFISREERRRSDGRRSSDRFVLHLDASVTNQHTGEGGDDSASVTNDHVTNDHVTNDHVILERTSCDPDDIRTSYRTTREPSEGGAPPKRRRKTETPLPADWTPSQSAESFAASHGLDIEYEAQQFTGHATANDRRLRDWDAGFRTWLGKSAKWAAERAVKSGNNTLGNLALIQQWEAEENGTFGGGEGDHLRELTG